MKNVGQVGSIGQENIQYTPATDSSPFFLNTRAAADANGTISRVKYCYTLPDDNTDSYRATIGLYRPQGGSFNLLNSFSLTKTGNTLQGPRDEFVCEEMDIPSLEVQEGDVMGACMPSRSFTFLSAGPINLVAELEDRGEILMQFQSLTQALRACLPVGTIPSVVSSGNLRNTSVGRLLMIAANIMKPGESLNCG